jgi:MFS family permease
VGVLVNYIDRVNISVAHEALHAEFGISMVTFGYVLSAFNWSYTLAQLPMGVLLDRLGVKTMGRIGSLLWCVASFGTALAPGIGTFFGMRLLLGIGEAPTFPGNAKAIGQRFPKSEIGLATAIFDSAAKLGPAIAVPLCRFRLAESGVFSGFLPELSGAAEPVCEGGRARRRQCPFPARPAEGAGAGDGFFRL